MHTHTHTHTYKLEPVHFLRYSFASSDFPSLGRKALLFEKFFVVVCVGRGRKEKGVATSDGDGADLACADSAAQCSRG